MNNQVIRKSCRSLLLALAMLASFAPSSFADLEGIDIHGFASQGHMGSTRFNYITPSLESSWSVSEYAVNMSTSLDDDLRVGIQLFARNLGDLGQNRVTLDWAFGDYHWDDKLGIRAGRVKMPYGLYNETADFDAVRTSVLLPQSVYDLRMRDFLVAVNGVNPYGSLDIPGAGGLDYSAYIGTVNFPLDGSVARFLNDAGAMTFVSLDNARSMGGQLIWNTPLDGLRVGHTLNSYSGNIAMELTAPTFAALEPLGATAIEDLDVAQFNLNTSSIEYTRGNLVLASEYSTWVGEFANPFVGLDVNWEKYYGQASYRINEWLELGTYYSVHYDDGDDHEGKNAEPGAAAFSTWQKDLAINFRFDLSPFMMFKIEGHKMDGYGLTLMQNNRHIIVDPSTIEQEWYMVASKISFLF